MAGNVQAAAIASEDPTDRKESMAADKQHPMNDYYSLAE